MKNKLRAFQATQPPLCLPLRLWRQGNANWAERIVSAPPIASECIFVIFFVSNYRKKGESARNRSVNLKQKRYWNLRDFHWTVGGAQNRDRFQKCFKFSNSCADRYVLSLLLKKSQVYQKTIGYFCCWGNRCNAATRLTDQLHYCIHYLQIRNLRDATGWSVSKRAIRHDLFDWMLVTVTELVNLPH